MAKSLENFSFPQKIPNKITIVGMMGVGKTTIGRLLAKKIELPFFDSDHEIEKSLDMSIPNIFKNHGESYFREYEKKIIKELLKNNEYVISTGGGSFLDTEMQNLINKNSFSIWINANINEVSKRIKNIDQRPLINKQNKLASLKYIFEKRKPKYAKAKLHIDSSKKNINEIINNILIKINTEIDGH